MNLAISFRRSLGLALPLIAALAGCGSGGVDLASVEGQVLLDGRPLAGGVVTTLPAQGRGARGELDEQGRFTLSSGSLGPGAAIGVHRVAVIAVADTGQLSPEAPKKLLTPEKYANPETSGLTIDVQPGANSAVLKLDSN
ncbi:MAG TPA: hypothetical protein VF175_14220 [Lacipirellula sp.]